CDAANLQRLIGRATGELSTAANGRTDVVFGDIHFWLPAGTPYYNVPAGRRLVHNQTAAHTRATTGNTTAAPTPLPQAGHTIEGFYVRLHYAMGEGPAANRGDITLTLRNANGQLNTSITEAGGEYELYSKAKRICDDWTANAPVHAHVYELLRFGRVIEPGVVDDLANVPHWRKINIPNVAGGASGERWVNLNNRTPGQIVTVFSDADFPHWRGWQIISDDSAPADNRCDSGTIRAMADRDGDGTVTFNELRAFLREDTLRRAICPIPCEWDISTIDARWGWLRTDAPHLPNGALSESHYRAFTNFVRALSFAPPQGLRDAVWRFHPREFIETFRKCGWLSENEFAQCIPRRNKHLSGTTFNTQTVATWNQALARAQTWGTHLNKTMRKYLINTSKQRILHFLAQVIEESGYLRLVKEGGGENASYAPYYGRGLIQLTRKNNYQTYGVYRGFRASYPFSVTNHPFGVAGTNPTNPEEKFSVDLGWNPNNLIVTNNNTYNAENCADSSGFYWVNRRITATGQTGLETSDAGIYIADIIQTCRLVNGNVSIQNINGLDVRLQLGIYLKHVLLDANLPTVDESITFDWRRRSTKELVTTAGVTQHVFVRTTHILDVILTWQRP
ncbi:MAG: hypothetical protein LBG78_04435, partial [Azoarcus sp.]|nr:hypothetical protein [Azoarcus sp.]